MRYHPITQEGRSHAADEKRIPSITCVFTRPDKLEYWQLLLLSTTRDNAMPNITMQRYLEQRKRLYSNTASEHLSAAAHTKARHATTARVQALPYNHLRGLRSGESFLEELSARISKSLNYPNTPSACCGPSGTALLPVSYAESSGSCRRWARPVLPSSSLLSPSSSCPGSCST